MLEGLFDLAAGLTGGERLIPPAPWVTYPAKIVERGRQLHASVTESLGLAAGSTHRVAAINLSAGLERREWPLQSTIRFTRTAIERHRDRIDGWVVLTDPAEPARAHGLVAAVGSPRLTVAPAEHDFRAVMELIGRVDLVITPDTSVSHAASAMGTPALVLMIGENVVPWRPVGIPHRLAVSPDQLQLGALSVDDALTALDSLLDAVASSSSPSAGTV
jgi:ADP-heptose:LPS heptosyltransferase